MSDVLLSVQDLSVRIGHRRVVADVSFQLNAGETLAIVGESGSGKSMTARAICGLVGRTAGGKIESGRILLALSDGHTIDLCASNETVFRAIRGREVSLISQDPLMSLNPVLTCGSQIAEAVRIHQRLGRVAAWARAIELLDLVHIRRPEDRVRDYPHQLSGGMRQRVAIAIAIACEPRVLIADEPTTALDVTVKRRVLELLEELKERLGMSMLFISHDLGVVADIAQRVVVMKDSRVVEAGTIAEVLEAPRAAYTKMLLASVPRLGEMSGVACPMQFEIE